MTDIAAVNDCHCCCHTVDNDNCQKPAVVVCHQWRQWQSLSMEAAVDGSRGNDGFCQRWLLLIKAAVGKRDNHAMALDW
jgi:hypothetical protein